MPEEAKPLSAEEIDSARSSLACALMGCDERESRRDGLSQAAAKWMPALFGTLDARDAEIAALKAENERLKQANRMCRDTLEQALAWAGITPQCRTAYLRAALDTYSR